MSLLQQKKERRVINKFQSLVRSGMDYNVEYMCSEAGKSGLVGCEMARKIINKYYNGLISKDMVSFIRGLNGSKHSEKISLFSERFKVCERESRLLIRYIKRSKNNG